MAAFLRACSEFPKRLQAHLKPQTQMILSPPKYVVVSLLVSFGGMLFGLDTGTIGPITTMPQFASILGHMSSTLHGLVVSSILLPAAIASFFCGHLADALGRPKVIAIGAAIFGLGNSIEAGSVHLAMLIIGRVITGIGEGLYLSTLVVYICEISPPRHRGPLASVPQLLITIGLCAGYFICYGTVNIDSSFAWRLPWIMQSFLAFLFSASSAFLLPHSPRWLTLVGRGNETEHIWSSLGVSAAEREKAEEQPLAPNTAPAQAAVENSKKEHKFFKVFARKVWKRTALGVFLLGMQQMSGIDGVLYYAPLLFQQAGLSSSKASFLASGVSAILIFVVTIPAFLWSDRWGRRTSSIVGGLGLGACMLLIGSLYASHSADGAGRWVVIVAIYAFAVIFSITWAVGLKIYASEIQPQETRAAASSLAYTSNWIVNWIVAFTTPIFLSRSNSGVYFLFGAATLLTVVVCVFFMPETRGKTLEAINESFEKENSDAASTTGTANLLRGFLNKRKQAANSPPASLYELRPVPLRSLEDAMVL